MKKFQKVELYNEPIQILKLSPPLISEMADSELGFLCGLLKNFKPKKIVELGVAAGGTTTVILNCIKELQLECHMYSVDIRETYYRDTSKATGYLVNEVEPGRLDTSMHEVMLGKVLPERIENIGGDIDFLILDTAHTMPGEVLEFLVAFPYLKKGAVVVIHDTAFQFIRRKRHGIATSVLFQSVVADKFLNNNTDYPNIAAFQITEDTEKYIQDVFAALMIPWKYMPDSEQMKAYKKVIAKFYDPECMQLLDQAEKASGIMIQNEIEPGDFGAEIFLRENDYTFLKGTKRILIYGMGYRGKALWNYAKENQLKVDGFVLSDDQKMEEGIEGKPVYYLSEIPYKADQVLIVLAVSLDTEGARDIEKNLIRVGYDWMKISEESWVRLT